jgi:hypothetical protein
MKPSDFELRLHRNLAVAEREAGPLEITPCTCPGAFGQRTSCHIALRGPEHLAAVVAALTRAGVTGIDRLGFDPDGRFLHLDVEGVRGRKRAWLIGNRQPEGADQLFGSDVDRFRFLSREVQRQGKTLRSLKICEDRFSVNGVTTRHTGPPEPDPSFVRRQARAAALAARRAAIREFAENKRISLGEAETLLAGKAA